MAVQLLADRALLLRRPALDAPLDDAARVVPKNDVVDLAADRPDYFSDESLAPLQGSLALAQLVPLEHQRFDKLVVGFRELSVGSHLLLAGQHEGGLRNVSKGGRQCLPLDQP